MTNKRIHELDVQSGLNTNDVLALDNSALGEAVKIAVAEFQAAHGDQVANRVFAGPSAGGDAAPAFRILVLVDIPALPTSKITSGTLDDARVAESNVTQHEAALTVTESQISDLAHTDANAIHDNVASEISAITAKATPVVGDFLLIEDSADSNSKKRITIDDLPGGGTSITVDTKTALLATTPTSASLGYASDVERFYVYDGSAWYESAVVFGLRSDMDMGYEKDNSTTGYGDDYIVDKTLSNVVLQGHGATAQNGSFRVDITETPNTFEIYLRDLWQMILYDLTYASGDFRHTPLSEDIYVWRGDSVSIGLNGRPVISEYEASMGAYPPARTLSGGTF